MAHISNHLFEDTIDSLERVHIIIIYRSIFHDIHTLTSQIKVARLLLFLAFWGPFLANFLHKNDRKIFNYGRILKNKTVLESLQ